MGATFLDRNIDQTVAGEATPCLELGADARIAAGHGHEIALTAAAQHSYQIGQEARGKRLGAGVELNVRVRPHAMHYSICVKKSKTGLGSPNCTFVSKHRRQGPFRVDWC